MRHLVDQLPTKQTTRYDHPIAVKLLTFTHHLTTATNHHLPHPMDMLRRLIKQRLHNINIRHRPPMYLCQPITAGVSCPLYLGRELGGIGRLSLK